MTKETKQQLWNEARGNANTKALMAAEKAVLWGAGKDFEIGILQEALTQAFYDLTVLQLEIKESAVTMQALLEKLKD